MSEGIEWFKEAHCEKCKLYKDCPYEIEHCIKAELLQAQETRNIILSDIENVLMSVVERLG